MVIEPKHVGAVPQPHHQINHNDVFQLIILVTVTVASSYNTFPDDYD